MRTTHNPDVGVGGGGYRPIRAPRGAEISCKGWQQEAALRMLMNSVDPDVAEQPESLIVSRELGAVAADWTAFRAIADSLRHLPSNSTLLVQEGKLTGVTSTSVESPRALILNSDPAACWTYIGPQGFLPEAYENFTAAKKQRFGGELGGKLTASLGMSGRRAALPLAATMNGAAFLGIDADAGRIKRSVKAGYCDVMVNNLDEALRILKNAVRKCEAASVGLIGELVHVISEMASRGVVPDLLAEIGRDQEDHTASALRDGVRQLESFGSIVFRPFSSIDASDSVYWVALSGEASDIQRTDRLLLDLFPDGEPLGRWIQTLGRRSRHQGLPARASCLSAEQRSRFGIALNRLVAAGEVKAPFVIVRQAAAYARTQNSATKTQEFAPLSAGHFDTLLRLSSGSTWSSVHRDEYGNAGVMVQAMVADGTGEMDARIERVLSPANLPTT